MFLFARIASGRHLTVVDGVNHSNAFSILLGQIHFFHVRETTVSQEGVTVLCHFSGVSLVPLGSLGLQASETHGTTLERIRHRLLAPFVTSAAELLAA